LKPELKQIPISSIDPNTHRKLATYPWIEKKLEALESSINEVGLWEGIIARPVGRRYQIAFGHHRLEAATRNGLKKIPVIVRDLSDLQMLQFMGRENGEDYKTEFLVLLSTWEGATEYLRVHPENKSKEYQILGWHERKRKNDMSYAARACSHAEILLEGDYIHREDLRGLAVDQAEKILGRAMKRMKAVDDLAASENVPTTKREANAVKAHVAKGARKAAKQARDGTVATKDLRTQVDINTHESAARSKIKKSPLFAKFGEAIAKQVSNFMRRDTLTERLDNIIDSLPLLEDDHDFHIVGRIRFELSELADRASSYDKKLGTVRKGKSISPIRPRLQEVK